MHHDRESAAGGAAVAKPSRIDTEMFRALEHTQQRMFPGAVTLPTMLTGATDMAQLRARGVRRTVTDRLWMRCEGGAAAPMGTMNVSPSHP